MANKLVGLVGPGTGPRLCIKRFQNLKARVRGLVNGTVEAHVEHDQGTSVVLFVVDGDLELPRGHFVTFKHEGKCKNVLCTVMGN